MSYTCPMSGELEITPAASEVRDVRMAAIAAWLGQRHISVAVAKNVIDPDDYQSRIVYGDEVAPSGWNYAHAYDQWFNPNLPYGVFEMDGNYNPDVPSLWSDLSIVNGKVVPVEGTGAHMEEWLNLLCKVLEANGFTARGMITRHACPELGEEVTFMVHDNVVSVFRKDA